jgi:hypothetical protein
VLTGRLPEHTGVWHYRNRFRDLHPDLQTPRGTRSSLRTSRTRPTLTDVSPTSLRRHLKSLAGSPRHSFLPLVSSSRTCRSTLRNFGGTSTAAATLLRRYGQPVRAPLVLRKLPLLIIMSWPGIAPFLKTKRSPRNRWPNCDTDTMPA